MQIDAEFEALIPPLRPEELAQLEANIVAEGIRDPLVTWRGVLIDGHNRYAIAQKHGLSYATVEREFEHRDAAVLWIVYNQFGRRNLSVPSRAELAMRIEPILAAQAKARQVAAGGDKVSDRAVVPILEQALKRDVNATKTATLAAEAAGLKRVTYHKAKTVLTTAPAEIVEAFRAGDITTNQAYQHIKREERRAEWQAEVAAQLAVTPSGPPIVDQAHASEWLASIAPASVDLLLTDPPYSTDVGDIAAFAQDWLPKALRTLKPTGRAFVCVGAYPTELAATWRWPCPRRCWSGRTAIQSAPLRRTCTSSTGKPSCITRCRMRRRLSARRWWSSLACRTLMRRMDVSGTATTHGKSRANLGNDLCDTRPNRVRLSLTHFRGLGRLC